MHTDRHDNKPKLRALRVDASGRGEASVTRGLVDGLLEHLEESVDLELTTRDLASGMPFVNAAWIDANFTAGGERSAAQRAALATSDALVEELVAADVVIIGAPMYNFGIPASLKAWIDMIARARLTFRYTPNGPEGLLRGKKAYLVMASGGVAIDSGADFATPYLRYALGFLGITDVEVIAAERIEAQGDDAFAAAREQTAAAASRVAAIA